MSVKKVLGIGMLTAVIAVSGTIVPGNMNELIPSGAETVYAEDGSTEENSPENGGSQDGGSENENPEDSGSENSSSEAEDKLKEIIKGIKNVFVDEDGNLKENPLESEITLPDGSTMTLEDYLNQEIKKLLPDSVNIGSVSYNPETGELTLPEGAEEIAEEIEKILKESSDGIPPIDINIEVPDLKKERFTHEKYLNGYEDGTVRPEGVLTRGEAAAIYSRLIAEKDSFISSGSTDYDDIDGAWYSGYAEYMTEKGIMNGYPDGTFRGEKPLTRAELSKMISKQFEGNGEETDFSDIEGHWAKESIEKVYAEGIVNGYPDGTFRPDESITRAEAVKMFNILFDRGADAESIDGLISRIGLTEFEDIFEEHWAYYEIMEASNSHRYEKTGEKRTDELWKRILFR